MQRSDMSADAGLSEASPLLTPPRNGDAKLYRKNVALSMACFVPFVVCLVFSGTFLQSSSVVFPQTSDSDDVKFSNVKEFLTRLSEKGCDYSCPNGRQSVIRVEGFGPGAGLGDRIWSMEQVFKFAELTCAQVWLNAPTKFLAGIHQGGTVAENWSTYVNVQNFRDGYPVLLSEEPKIEALGGDFFSNFEAAATSFEGNQWFRLDWTTHDVWAFDRDTDMKFRSLPLCTRYFKPSQAALAMKNSLLQTAGLTDKNYFTYHLRRGDMGQVSQETCGQDVLSVSSLNEALTCHQKMTPSQSAPNWERAKQETVIFFSDETNPDYIRDLKAMLGTHFKEVASGEEMLVQAAYSTGNNAEDNNLKYAASVLVQNNDLVDGKMVTHISIQDPKVCQGVLFKGDCSYNYASVLGFFEEPFDNSDIIFDSLHWLMDRLKSTD